MRRWGGSRRGRSSSHWDRSRDSNRTSGRNRWRRRDERPEWVMMMRGKMREMSRMMSDEMVVTMQVMTQMMRIHWKILSRCHSCSSLRLVSTILKPNLDLCFGQFESGCQICSLWSGKILLKGESPLQLKDLWMSEGGSASFLFLLHQGEVTMMSHWVMRVGHFLTSRWRLLR